MDVLEGPAKSILTPQVTGLLASAPYPFTHSLSPYTGCAFGATACGLYCYAQFLPSWHYAPTDKPWGGAVVVKTNAAQLLGATLARLAPAKRARLRILMASTTDPYQPLERRHRVTRACLEVFARYPELDLLVVQTRGPLVAEDFALLAQLPYAWLSMTVETDDQSLLDGLGGGPPLARRLATVTAAAARGIKTQVAVSPCLTHSPDFADRLLATGARRFIVDTPVDGDGSHGARTARSPFATRYPTWRDPTPARRLFGRLGASGATVGWSSAGFCGIPPRQRQLALVV